MDMDYASKKVANAGLATGIVGTSLGALNALGNVGGIIGGMAMGNAANCNRRNYYDNYDHYDHYNHHNHYNHYNEYHFPDTPISKYEFNEAQGYIRQIEDKNAEIAYLRSEKYSDQVGMGVYKELAAMIKEERIANQERIDTINQQLCAQAVMNQSTKDSFQLLQERLDCCKHEMCDALARERDERRCADNTIVTYTNATFYPKEVADVTVGATTVAQTVYNPLPVSSYSYGCGCGH